MAFLFYILREFKNDSSQIALMNHYLHVCRRIVSGKKRFLKRRLLVTYISLLIRSFISSRFKPTSGEKIIADLMGLRVASFSYPQLINLFEEIFIFETYAVSNENVPENIIDCGSNIGLSVLYFNRLYPQSRILAFEPDADTFALLNENVVNNDSPHVQIFQLALSDMDSTDVDFYRNPKRKDALTMSMFQSNEKTDRISVPSRQLSTFITADIDLLKIDVEGAELLILQDLVDNRKIQFIRQIIIEYHPTITGQSVESLIKLLEENDFSCTHQIDTLHPGATEIMVRAGRRVN